MRALLIAVFLLSSGVAHADPCMERYHGVADKWRGSIADSDRRLATAYYRLASFYSSGNTGDSARKHDLHRMASRLETEASGIRTSMVIEQVETVRECRREHPLP